VNPSIKTPTRRAALLAVSALAGLFVSVAAAGDKDAQWAKGVAYTTDWKKAIKTARETGRMIFIYNGWARSGI
jgi:hypothetical protein